MAVIPVNRLPQLPNQIPPQSSPLIMDGGNGTQVLETNWWLFLYNIATQVINLGGGPVNLPDSVNIAISESEVFDSDGLQSARQALNVALQLPDAEVTPTLRDMADALLLAQDGLLQDPMPRAQPAAVVTVTASPFTFTAPANGTLSVAGGTVSAIALIRQGVTVATGLIAGLIPTSRLDQVQITYTGAPTAVFLPS